MAIRLPPGRGRTVRRRGLVHASLQVAVAAVNELRGSGMPWLTIQEAADLLRVPVSWLYERTRTNSVPHVKLGKYLRFNSDELAAWIDALRRDRCGPAAVKRSPRSTIHARQR
jgi:excisionase family DNA binding protein